MRLMVATTLALRDVHLPPAPPWWPLSPGFWLVLALLVLVGAVAGLRSASRYRRRRQLEQEFDRRMAGTVSPVEQVMRMAELLRRAALACDAGTAGLHGEAWLAWLDRGLPGTFSGGAGRLLLDGGYRQHLEPAQAQALWPLARRCYARLRMTVRS